MPSGVSPLASPVREPDVIAAPPHRVAGYRGDVGGFRSLQSGTVGDH